MQGTGEKNNQRIRVGGIKLSQELVQFTCSRRHQADPCTLTAALKEIAARQIALSYLTTSSSAGIVSTSFCAAGEHRVTVTSILEATLTSMNSLQLLPAVGTITIFPHRNSLGLLAKILRLLSTDNHAVHGVCTSISALSIVTDYATMEKAATLLQQIIELPENHTPLRQEFTVRQVSDRDHT